MLLNVCEAATTEDCNMAECSKCGGPLNDETAYSNNRLQRLPAGTDDSPVHIIPVAVDELLTETFKLALLLLQGG